MPDKAERLANQQWHGYGVKATPRGCALSPFPRRCGDRGDLARFPSLPRLRREPVNSKQMRQDRLDENIDEPFERSPVRDTKRHNAARPRNAKQDA